MTHLVFVTSTHSKSNFSVHSTKARGPTENQAPRKQKVLWSYFEKLRTYRPNSRAMDRKLTKAKCLLCLNTLKTPDSTPNPLKVHLKAHHPVHYNEWLDRKKAEDELDVEAKKRIRFTNT